MVSLKNFKKIKDLQYSSHRWRTMQSKIKSEKGSIRNRMSLSRRRLLRWKLQLFEPKIRHSPWHSRRPHHVYSIARTNRTRFESEQTNTNNTTELTNANSRNGKPFSECDFSLKNLKVTVHHHRKNIPQLIYFIMETHWDVNMNNQIRLLGMFLKLYIVTLWTKKIND